MIEDWVSLKINRYFVPVHVRRISKLLVITSKKKEVTVDTCGTTNALK